MGACKIEKTKGLRVLGVLPASLIRHPRSSGIYHRFIDVVGVTALYIQMNVDSAGVMALYIQNSLLSVRCA
jgi:hypothetical protein